MGFEGGRISEWQAVFGLKVHLNHCVAVDGLAQLCLWLFVFFQPEAIRSTHVFSQIRAMRGQKHLGAVPGCGFRGGDATNGTPNDNNVHVVGQRNQTFGLADATRTDRR